MRSRVYLRSIVLLALASFIVWALTRRPEEQPTGSAPVESPAASAVPTVAQLGSGEAPREIILVTGPCPAGSVKLAPPEKHAPCFTACDAASDCPPGLACIDEATTSGAKVKICAAVVEQSAPSASATSSARR